MIGAALYGGVPGRQPADRGSEPSIGASRDAFARALLAALLGLAAALLPWSDPDAGVGDFDDVDLLSPRGIVAAPPTRVCWRPVTAARRVQVRIVDPAGEVVIDRTADFEPGARELRLTAEEQARLAGREAASVELLWMTGEGELVARSRPARFTLPPRDPAPDLK